MKRFLGYFAASLLLIASIAVVVCAMTDATGFRLYLADVLPFKSMSFLLVLSGAGFAYTVLAGIKYYALGSQRDKKLPGYLVDMAFGLVGAALASASYVTLPFADTDGLVAAKYSWLLFLLEQVMSLCGVFFPAISAITFTLVAPLVGGSVGNPHELDATYGSKLSHPES
jgi:hypothetical protein